MHIPDCPVCVDKSRPRLHLPERHAEWRNCRQCYNYGRGQQSWLQVPNALHSRQTFLRSTGRDCFRLHRNHFLPFSFFLLHLSTTFCSGWWRSSWYVGVIHRNADRKNHFPIFEWCFWHFLCFLQSWKPNFWIPWQKTFKKMQTCAYKSLTGFVLERFFKSLYRPIQIVQVAKG